VTVIVLESHRTWQARQTDGAGRADRASPLFRSLPAVPKAVTGEVLVEVAERQRQDVRKALVSEVIYLVFLLAVALVLGAGIVWTESEKQRLVARLMLLYLYGPMLVLIAIERSVDWVRRWRSLRQRIGTDGSAMLYDEGSGEVRRYGWNAVVTNGRALLADSTMIHLYGGKRYDPTSVFAAEALRECVLARLPRCSLVKRRLIAAELLRAVGDDYPAVLNGSAAGGQKLTFLPKIWSRNSGRSHQGRMLCKLHEPVVA
jgi:hypothetical protein